MVELKQAATLDGARLAALFTAGYEGYWFPIAVDAPAFALMTGTTDVDLRLSRVAIEDGEPVAIALVARRDTEGWIGGMGVVASHRRRGLGEATLVAALDAARAAGIERVTLEVLEQNHPARTLYERLGFEHVRELEVWSHPGRVDPEPNREAADLDDALAWIAARRTEAEPWQRADRTVARRRELGERLGVVAVVDGASELRAAAVVRSREGRRAVEQAAAVDAAAAGMLLDAVGAGAESVLWLNLPADHPLRPALAAAAGEPAARQHELSLDL